MSTTKEKILEDIKTSRLREKTPCLTINKEESVKYKALDYANLDVDIQDSKDTIIVCPSFPTGRAIYVLEYTHFIGTKISNFIVEFYEFLYPTGWKFKRQYNERVFE